MHSFGCGVCKGPPPPSCLLGQLWSPFCIAILPHTYRKWSFTWTPPRWNLGWFKSGTCIVWIEKNSKWFFCLCISRQGKCINVINPKDQDIKDFLHLHWSLGSIFSMYHRLFIVHDNFKIKLFMLPVMLVYSLGFFLFLFLFEITQPKFSNKYFPVQNFSKAFLASLAN